MLLLPVQCVICHNMNIPQSSDIVSILILEDKKCKKCPHLRTSVWHGVSCNWLDFPHPPYLLELWPDTCPAIIAHSITNTNQTLDLSNYQVQCDKNDSWFLVIWLLLFFTFSISLVTPQNLSQNVFNHSLAESNCTVGSQNPNY